MTITSLLNENLNFDIQLFDIGHNNVTHYDYENLTLCFPFYHINQCHVQRLAHMCLLYAVNKALLIVLSMLKGFPHERYQIKIMILGYPQP